MHIRRADADFAAMTQPCMTTRRCVLLPHLVEPTAAVGLPPHESQAFS